MLLLTCVFALDNFLFLSSCRNFMFNKCKKMAHLVGGQAPNFCCIAVSQQDFREVSLQDCSGKCVVLFFYPMDFTKVCSSEIAAISDLRDEFTKRNCEVLGISCDSHFTHLAWINKLRTQTNKVEVAIPLLSDKSGKISKEYGIFYEENGISNRAFFLIDHQQFVRNFSINDHPVGQSIEEILKLLDTIQSETTGDESWNKQGLKRRLTDQEKCDNIPFKTSKTSYETNVAHA